MTGDDRLDSWKEIAAYLGREVRTVQLWEKSEGLPIHRHQHARQGSVFAFKNELDSWRQNRKNASVRPGEPPPPANLRLPLIGAAIGLVIIAGIWFWRTRQNTPSTAVVSSVAVLPFVDFSPQHDQEYFSDGLTEEIIDALSRVPNLRVVARTSSFAFKGKARDIREIGRQLNVNAVLEGSVRKAGDQLRITAQLNRVSDGYHLWSRTYDRKLSDVFEVQRDISQSIGGEVRVATIERHPTSDLQAYQLYQEGRYIFNKFQPPDSNLKAIDRFKEAIQRDPKFALAYAGMADAYAYLAENFVMAPKEVMPKAKAAAEQAVALDPNSAEAHTSLGAVKLDYDWDREGAQRELRKALELSPGSAWAHHWYAHSLEAQGRLEEALVEMRFSLTLDPLSIPINWDIGNELICAGKLDEALRHLERASDLFPNQPVITFLRVNVLYRKSDLQAAHKILEALKTSAPEQTKEPFFIAMLGVSDAYEGRVREARQALDQMEQLRQKQYVEPFMLLELCSLLKDRRALLLWTQRVKEDRSTLYLYMPLIMSYYGSDPEAKALAPKI